MKCSICLSGGHLDKTCFYIYPELASNSFNKKYPDAQSRKAALILRKAENTSRKNNERIRKEDGNEGKGFTVNACLPDAIINNALCLPHNSSLAASTLSLA